MKVPRGGGGGGRVSIHFFGRNGRVISFQCNFTNFSVLGLCFAPLAFARLVMNGLHLWNQCIYVYLYAKLDESGS